MTTVTRIIGIDPGLRHTGWGVIDSLGNSVHFVASGSVNSNGDLDLASRLVQIHDGLDAVLHQYQPDEAAIEHHLRQQGCRRDAEARPGAWRRACWCRHKRGLPVAEYAPNAVKKAIVGAGHAEKGQIRVMVKVLMPKATFESDDAADALAIALTHAHHREFGGGAARQAGGRVTRRRAGQQ